MVVNVKHHLWISLMIVLMRNRRGKKNWDNEAFFKVDTLEKAQVLLNTIRMRRDEGTIESLKYLYGEIPELRRCTHEYVSNLLGWARETVARSYKYTW
jgi:hypothetical protein